MLLAAVAPGWLLCRVLGLGGGEGTARQWLLSVFASPLLVAVATRLLAEIGGLSLDAASHAAWWAILMGLVILAWRESAGVSSRAPHRGDALLLVPAVVVCAVAAGVLWPEGSRVSYHASLHVGLVAQIHQGQAPPDHLSLAGLPIDFYWFYHWLLASWIALSGLPVLVCAPFSALSALFVYLGGAALLLRRFLSPLASALAAPAAAFGANLLNPATLVGGWLAAGPPDRILFWPFQVLAPGVLGGDPRLVTLLAKFLNLNGFPMGLAAWAVLLDQLLPEVETHPAPSVSRALPVFLSLCSAVLFHTTTALVACPVLGAAILFTRTDSLRPGAIATQWRAIALHSAVFAAALLATAPYLLGVVAGSSSLREGSPYSWLPSLRYNAAGFALSMTPVVAVLLWAASRPLRRRPLGISMRFLTVVTLALVVLALTLLLPDNNQYKLQLLSSLPAGVLLFAALRDELAQKRTRLYGVLFATGVALGVLVVGFTLAAYRIAASSQRTDIVGDGAYYLAMPGKPQLDSALRWLRQNTPVDAVVVARPTPFGGSWIRSVSGRAAFLLTGGGHIGRIPEAERRAAPVRDLFAAIAPPGEALERIHARVRRPVYVLLTRDEFPQHFERLRRHFDAAPETEQVHASEDVVVYAFVPSREAPD